jgi:EAL domain-containing protein (putative c-di-GMP-specific phosphodiesterase class I)
MLDEHGEIVAANEFIAAAERYGSIAKIDCWLIETFFSNYHNLSGNNLLVKACIRSIFLALALVTMGL